MPGLGQPRGDQRSESLLLGVPSVGVFKGPLQTEEQRFGLLCMGFPYLFNLSPGLEHLISDGKGGQNGSFVALDEPELASDL